MERPLPWPRQSSCISSSKFWEGKVLLGPWVELSGLYTWPYLPSQTTACGLPWHQPLLDGQAGPVWALEHASLFNTPDSLSNTFP